MKIIILSILLASSIMPVFSQLDDSTASVTAYWKKGQDLLYEIKVTHHKYENQKLIERFQIIFDATVKVLSSSTYSYIITWQLKQRDSVIGAWPQIPFVFRDLQKIFYKTNEYGIFMELLNWKELAELYQESHPSLNEMLIREDVERLIIPEILQFHLNYGNLYFYKESFSVPSLMRIPFSDTMEQVNSSIAFTGRSIKNSTADIVLTIGMYDVHTNTITQEPINVDERVDYSIDLNVGWPLSVNSRRRIWYGTFEDIEMWSIVRR